MARTWIKREVYPGPGGKVRHLRQDREGKAADQHRADCQLLRLEVMHETAVPWEKVKSSTTAVITKNSTTLPISHAVSASPGARMLESGHLSPLRFRVSKTFFEPAYPGSQLHCETTADREFAWSRPLSGTSDHPPVGCGRLIFRIIMVETEHHKGSVKSGCIDNAFPCRSLPIRASHGVADSGPLGGRGGRLCQRPGRCEVSEAVE